MPSANDFLAQDDNLRICIYGPAKSKKTWWALRAAESGFRVLLFDFDKNSGIVKMIPEQFRKNIYILRCHDGVNDGFASLLTTAALRSFNFWLDEKSRQLSVTPKAGMVHFDLRGFGRDTVLVLDSYSALAISVVRQFCIENNIDLAQAELLDVANQKTSQNGFQWYGSVLDWHLTQLKALNCNVVVVGHETQYDKYKKRKDGKRSMEIEFSRRQIKSSSQPHSMSIGKHFTDILYCYAEGRQFKIDTRGNKLEEAGGTNVAPGLYAWEDLSFAKVASMAGIPNPQNVEPFNFPVQEALLQVKKTPVTKPVAKAQPVIIPPQRTSSLITFKI